VSENRLIEVRNLKRHFPVLERGVLKRRQVGIIRACDGISFTILEGETLGLVGESGCGKTTAARVILGLIPPTAGEVFLRKQNVLEVFSSKDKEAILNLRARMQLVFQNPYASLNPRMTVHDIIMEPFRIHRHVLKEEYSDQALKALEVVGLEPEHAERYPHEFSGGQRQRICIARALAVRPEFLILDEPVSSLDVSVRAQILTLLREIQAMMGTTYLYISHDLASVKFMSDFIAVMYLGKIVELAEQETFFSSPIHPYSQALISAIPRPNPRLEPGRIILPGEVPSALNPPEGCRFHPRCIRAKTVCKTKEPQLIDLGNHWVACFRNDEVDISTHPENQ